MIFAIELDHLYTDKPLCHAFWLNKLFENYWVRKKKNLFLNVICLKINHSFKTTYYSWHSLKQLYKDMCTMLTLKKLLTQTRDNNFLKKDTRRPRTFVKLDDGDQCNIRHLEKNELLTIFSLLPFLHHPHSITSSGRGTCKNLIL